MRGGFSTFLVEIDSLFLKDWLRVVIFQTYRQIAFAKMVYRTICGAWTVRKRLRVLMDSSSDGQNGSTFVYNSVPCYEECDEKKQK